MTNFIINTVFVTAFCSQELVDVWLACKSFLTYEDQDFVRAVCTIEGFDGSTKTSLRNTRDVRPQAANSFYMEQFQISIIVQVYKNFKVITYTYVSSIGLLRRVPMLPITNAYL